MTAPGSERNSKPGASKRASRRAEAEKVPYAYDTALYRQRYKVENLFAKLKDWQRIATRYDRCAHTICIAAAVIFWL
ncbi:IS5 family insertion sequence transposase domain-containing protein (plasmid) [Rhizobium etli 8C-3]|uniref:IS5 family insertion sequence transposase domain-containing protein n=2 Tax=Rhizobium TaxID=379 RepID=A0A1L5PDJ4_RHIET|nr:MULTISPECIES: transposase [Rhizobium]APO78257.1 IS5 family insertion sequence transposase domain-containing protein [Rhizobium etli 8C-3]TCU40772.1 DDE family transposase [Rhizobium azibense]